MGLKLKEDRAKHMFLLTIVFVVLILFGLFLMNFEVEDGVTTLTGKTHSWTTHPYYNIGFNLTIICVVSLTILLMLWIEIRI